MLPTWTQSDINVNGVTIHYTRTGHGEKPPMVLAHGFSDSGMCWLKAARDLSIDYDLILPDARGHGHSARVTPGEEVDMAADLAGLVHALGLEHPILGGHSMGANVSSQAEACFPGLARALILEDPGWHVEPRKKKAQPPVEEQETPDPWIRFLLAAKDQPIEAVIAWCRKSSPTWAEIELQPWADSKQQFDANFMAQARGKPVHWRQVVSRITCPTLLLTADPKKGAIVTRAMARQVVKLNPRFQVAYIPGAGHNIRRENFQAYMQAVWAFLKTLDN